jgi:hypothetical protein
LRKFFFGIGIFSAIFVTVILIGIGYAVFFSAGQDEEAKRYVDSSLIAITSNWDVNELRSRASQELLRSTKQDDLVSLFTRFATLGPLVEYEGSKREGWKLFINIGTNEGNGFKATYVAHGKYNNGKAEIHCVIVKLGDVWKIIGFHVIPSALIADKAGRNT